MLAGRVDHHHGRAVLLAQPRVRNGRADAERCRAVDEIAITSLCKGGVHHAAVAERDRAQQHRG